MPRLGRNIRLTFLALFFISAAASPNFPQCLARFKELNITDGGIDYVGRPVINPQDAVGLTYLACVQHCGPDQESFSWTVFSQQFSAWLLPWLALVSQLPFGAENSLDNLISGQFPRSIHQLVVLMLFSPSSPSCPHCWISHSGSILARPHSRQHSLGQQSVFGRQVSQPQECCQGSGLPPAGSTASEHPRRSPRISHRPTRE